MTINFKHREDIKDPQNHNIESQKEFLEVMDKVKARHGMVDISFSTIKSVEDVEEAIQILQGIKEIVGTPVKKMPVSGMRGNGTDYTFNNQDEYELLFRHNSEHVEVQCKMSDYYLNKIPVPAVGMSERILEHQFTIEVPGKYHYTFLEMMTSPSQSFINLIDDTNNFILENVIITELEDKREISTKENNFHVKFVSSGIIYL